MDLRKFDFSFNVCVFFFVSFVTILMIMVGVRFGCRQKLELTNQTPLIKSWQIDEDDDDDDQEVEEIFFFFLE